MKNYILYQKIQLHKDLFIYIFNLLKKKKIKNKRIIEQI